MTEDGRLPASPKRPRKDRRAGWRARLPTLAWHLEKLRQLEEAIERLLSQARVNAAGVAALMLRADRVRAKVDALATTRHDEIEGMDGDELVRWASQALEGWPDEALEVALRLYAERHGGHVRFIGPDGEQADFSPDSTWSGS